MNSSNSVSHVTIGRVHFLKVNSTARITARIRAYPWEFGPIFAEKTERGRTRTRQKRFETNTQEKVKKWTLELQKFAPFTTLHYILLLLNCLAFRLQTFLFVLLFVFLQISWLAFCLIAD